MKHIPILLLAVLFLGQDRVHASTTWPNEPASATQLLDCGFDNTTCGGQLKDPYKSSGYSLNVAQDATAPLSPSNVLRSTRFANVATGGTQLTYYLPAGANEIYAGLWWRTNPEFMGKIHGGNKLFFIRGQNTNNGVFMFILPRGSSSGSILWTTQTPNNLDQCGGADIDQCRSNINNVSIVPGTWYRIEVYMKASTTATSKDGIVRWWITPKGGTPVLAGNYENFAYGPTVDDWTWSETWDGSGPVNEWTTEGNHYIDHLHVSKPSGALPPSYLVITSSLSPARTGMPYSATLSANGGTKPYSWFVSSGNLPSGLSLNQNTGVISGTPTCVGRNDFTIRATDASAPAITTTKSYSVIVSGTGVCTIGMEGSRESRVGSGEQENGMRIESRAGTVRFNLPLTTDAVYKLSVYDLTGKKVYAHSSMGQKETSITRDLKNGVYVAKFVQGTQISALRFQVMN